MSTDLKDIQRWFSERISAQRDRRAAILVGLLSLLAIGATFLIGFSLGHQGEDEPKLWSTGPTIEHIQSLNQLVSTKVSISDILTGEAEGVRGVWLIKGDALIGVDLSNPDIQIPDQKQRHAINSLEQPVVLSARVDHERSMTWDVQRTTWIPWKGDKDRLRDKAMYHAQKLVEFAASQPELSAEAKRNASHAITDIYRSVDWQVEVRWK
jgi:hypothetical protein